MQNEPAQVPQGSPHKSKKKKKTSPMRVISRIIGKIFLTLFTLCVIAVVTVAIFVNYFMTYINNVLRPTVETTQLSAISMKQASTIYYPDMDSGGSWEGGEWTGEYKILRTIAGEEGNRELIEYGDLPDCLIQAVVAIEDHRFWEHNGVDWRGTARAIIYSVTGQSTQGGSTITQQMLRNVTEDNEVTVKRKFREIIRALDFDANNSKEDILTLYLNYVYFGQGCWGIQTASKKYFGKDVSELDLAESCAVVGITNNPSLYDPFRDAEFRQEDGSIKTPRDFNKDRQEDILNRMLELGIISQQECDAAKAEKLLFTDTDEYKALHANDEQALNESGSTYSWFEDAVIEDCIDLIAEANGVSSTVASTMLFNGGYHIYTTLNMDIQNIVDEVYSDPSNFDYPSAKGTPLDSGITVLDYYNGNIVATAGGVGEKEVSRDLSLARAKRACGSAIKPVSVYAPALDYGVIGPGSIIDDYPYKLNDAGTGGYPKNSNGHYRGPVSVTYGVQWSLNTVAARVVQLVGTSRSYDFMQNNLGFDLVEADNNVAPLSMGGLTLGVTTEQMAAAFGAFGNSGIYTKPRTVTRIESNDHTQVIVNNEVQSSVAMKETTAYLMTKLLRNVVSSGTGGSASFEGMSIAGKTGTTDENCDRYFVGYTPYYSAAVWVGYRSGSEKIQAGTKNPAALAWKMVMEEIHKNLENKSFPEAPSGIVTVNICQDCGLLADELCSQDYRGSRVVSGEFTEDSVPTEYCTCHVAVQMCRPTEGEDVYLASGYCPDATTFTRVMLVGREFLEIPDVGVVESDDEFAHLNFFRNNVGTCPIHTEDYVSSEEEEEPTLPEDELLGEGETSPESSEEAEDNSNGEGDTEEIDTTEPQSPGNTVENTDTNTGKPDSSTTTEPEDKPADPGKTSDPDGTTEPEEPEEPKLPDEPTEPGA